MGGIERSAVASCAWLGAYVACGGAALGQASSELERCAALIEAFDGVVLTRFDHRLLGLDESELAEARALRRDAEADCAAGRYGFGLQAIEEALRTVGLGPAIEDGAPPD